MRVHSDVATPVGAAQRAVRAPDVLDPDDAGKAVLLDRTRTGKARARVADAGAACPAFALEIED